ncbi:MAG: MFS transporter [Alphaproteobacteria bacterium]|nr:MFS transporter [Alphaproteobacteria bacterium]
MAAPAAPRLYFGQLTREQLRAFVAACIGYALDGYDFVIISLVLRDITSEFHLTLAAAGSLISAMFLARWMSGGFLGWIGDKLGRRTGMMLSILLYAGGTLLCGLAWSYWSLFMFRILVGIGVAGEYATSVTYVLETWPAHWRNRASAFLISTFYVGSALAAQVYVLVVPSFGWRALFFTGAAPILLAIYIRRGIIESPEWEESVAHGERPGRRGLGTLLRGENARTILMLVVVAFATFVANQTPKSFLPTYLASIGRDPGAVGNLMSTLSISTAVSMCILGIIADHVGTRRTLLGQYVLGAMALLLLFVPPQLGPVGAVVAIVLVGVTQQTVGAIVPKYVSQFFSTHVRCLSLGIVLNLGALGGSFGPVAAGTLGQRFGVANGVLYTVEGAMLVLIAVVALLREPAEPELEEARVAPASAA